MVAFPEGMINQIMEGCVALDRVMKYLEFLWALDILYRYYPRYHTHDLIILADDIYKWMNNELPENSSTLIYLKSCFSSPTEALKAVWSEIQLLAGPYMNVN